MRFIIIILLSLAGYSLTAQSIQGRALSYRVDADPNTITGLDVQSGYYETFLSLDINTGIWWDYLDSRVGPKWEPMVTRLSGDVNNSLTIGTDGGMMYSTPNIEQVLIAGDDANGQKINNLGSLNFNDSNGDTNKWTISEDGPNGDLVLGNGEEYRANSNGPTNPDDLIRLKDLTQIETFYEVVDNSAIITGAVNEYVFHAPADITIKSVAYGFETAPNAAVTVTLAGAYSHTFTPGDDYEKIVADLVVTEGTKIVFTSTAFANPTTEFYEGMTPTISYVLN